MLILEAGNIKKHYGDRLILDMESFKVYSEDRIGIVGMNGAGKTTLLNILSGRTSPDEGSVKIYGKCSYISQLKDCEEGEIEEKIAREFNIPGENEKYLSGGEKTRLKIAMSLSFESSIIFADEPTCNLDMEGISKLEEKLLSYKGAIVIISHDRELLDKVCSKIAEIRDGKIKMYNGNYSNYKARKEAEEERQLFEYEQYVSKKKALERAAIEKSRLCASLRKTPKRMGNSEARLHRMGSQKAKKKLDNTVKAIESRIEKLDKKEKPVDIDKARFDLKDSGGLYGRTAVSGEHICKSFGSRVLFDDIKFEVLSGSKTALLGGNGTGKTTLVNMIMEGVSGITKSKALKTGYFRQDLDCLDDNLSIIENLMKDCVYTEAQIRKLLAKLLFKNDDVYKKAGVLSGGERVKASIAKLLVSDANMLILDEPTNYLDIYSVEALESALKQYTGTMLLISHDRRFVENIADSILLIKDKKIEHFKGSYDEYQNRGKATDTDDLKKRKLVLENRLTSVLGRLSMPSKDDDVSSLDAEYKAILSELKTINQSM